MSDTKESFYQKHHADISSKILLETKKMLLKKGFGNVNMTSIAEKVGLSRQRLYCYFKNLDFIAYRIQIDDMKDFISFFEKRFSDDSLTPKGKLQKMIEDVFLYQEERPEDFLFTSGFDVFYRQKKVSEELIEEYKGIYAGKAVNEAFCQLFLQGILKGEFRKDLNPAETTLYWSNMLEMLLQRLSFFQFNQEGHSKEELELLKKNYLKAIFAYLRK
jgi:AcrR family transcriptional regulator